MKPNMLFRLTIDLILFISIIHGWWFFALPVGIFAAWRFSYFVELILAGIMYDSLFGLVPEMGISAWIGSISSIILFGVIHVLKKVARK